METETIDRLFLELSQFTSATTAKEIALQKRVDALNAAIHPFAMLVKHTSGRIPHERLSLADWAALSKAYQEAGKGGA
jgi:hypothetical protein